MTFETRQPRCGHRGSMAASLPATALTSVLGVALGASMLLTSPLATSVDPGVSVVPVAACTTHSSGIAKDVQVKVTRAKVASAKRVSVRTQPGVATVTVRVKLVVTAVGTASGYGAADACPSGVSNPQTVTKSITWNGAKAASTTYTSGARTTRVATKKATRLATKVARAAAVRLISTATAQTTETTIRDLAWAASLNTDGPTTG